MNEPGGRAKSPQRLLALALCVAGLGCLCSCRGPQGRGLTVAGSTSVQPIAELLADEYMAAHPGCVINVQGGGSSAGIQAALSGAADIGMSSRKLKEEERGLQQVLMARDAITLIVHPDNPVRALSSEQVRGIFAGRITRWEQLGGPEGGITVITREEGSGTRGAFEELVMAEEEIALDAIVQDSTGAARTIVASDPIAIAYVSLGMVTPQVVVVTLDGVKPTAESARSGRYLLTRPFLLLTRGEPRPLAQAYIDFVLSPQGQDLIEQEGYVKALPDAPQP